MTINSKLVDGTFPDYQRVIPRHNSKRMVMNAAVLDDAVEQASIVSAEKSRAARLSFSAGRCGITVNNGEGDVSSTEIGIEYDGDEIEVGFNARYVRDFMSEITGTTFTMEIEDAGTPAVVLDNAAPEWLGVLMPMRV